MQIDETGRDDKAFGVETFRVSRRKFAPTRKCVRRREKRRSQRPVFVAGSRTRPFLIRSI